MLSKKMAVSLMSLITLLALAFVAPSAMAVGEKGEFLVTVTGPMTATYQVDEYNKVTADVVVDLKVTSDQPIPKLTSGETPNLTLTFFDKDGLVIPATDSEVAQLTVVDDMAYAMRTGSVRQLKVTVLKNRTENPTLAKVVLTVMALESTDPTIVLTPKATHEKANMSLAAYHTITLSAAADTINLPKVVSIQRLRPGSQTVVAAFQEERIAPEAFDVRIVLTELPHGIKLDKTADVNAKNLVEVVNGTASNLVTGVPFTQLIELGSDGKSKSNGFTYRPHPSEGMYKHEFDNVVPGTGTTEVPVPTGTDKMYRQYRVTITPHEKTENFDAKIRVKSFHDNGAPIRNTYVPPGGKTPFLDSVHLPNGRDILTIPVKGADRDLTAGYKVTILKDWIIPANGYLVITKNTEGSEIDTKGQDEDRTNDTPQAFNRTPAQLLYNVYEAATLPNLATAFLNGVVVDVESQHAGLVISEVMWGEDVSLDPSSNSQYIELYNPGAQYKTIDDKDETPDVNEALTLIFYAPNEFDKVPAATATAATATAAAVPAALPTGVTDRIGTLDAKGTYWPPVGKGQSGRSGSTEGELTAGRGDFVPSVAIVSMYRSMVPSTAVGAAVGAMMVNDGQTAANWMTSAGPKSANFDPLAIGVRHGTPGAATDATTTPADTAKEAKAIEDKTAADKKKLDSTGTYPTLGQGRVYISEVMFAGGGTLPQWIEISNGDRSAEFNLSGWTLTVDNAAGDTDVSVGATATFTIPNGTKIAPSAPHDPSGDNTPSTILVVTEKGRNSFTRAKESAQILNLEEDNEVELILAGVVRGKYTLLSDMAFLITLAPPEPEATTAPAGETAAAKATRQAAEKKEANARKAATDIVGNLGADGAAAWALPMDEGARSSIIRLHVQVARGPAAPEKGTEADNWGLASETFFAQEMHTYVGNSYYGAANDKGTPGFRAGGALPVELSQFRPARDKVTGAVVITWSTQSELNNAGFFIKRSQQRDGEFKIINAAMISGAGTTSEKQSYTYTDTTAQPNVVYYYQIEDVSLDGNHQTLTRGIRLKGHVSVAGKATLTWGELKTSQ